MIVWPAKGPTEVEDFAFDFADVLDTGESISTKTVTADGATVNSSAISAELVQVWISAGAAGTVAQVRCTITTSLNRTYSELAMLPIGDEPVTLAEAKAQVNMVNDDSQDGFLTSLIAPARAYVEKVSTYSFVAGERTFTFGAFGDYLEIYLRPITSVDGVSYGPAGDDTDYVGAVAPIGRYPLRVYPTSGGSFPDLNDGEAVTVTVTTGALDPASLEYLIGKRAMLLIIGDWFEYREGSTVGTLSPNVQFALDQLLDTLGPVPAY